MENQKQFQVTPVGTILWIILGLAAVGIVLLRNFEVVIPNLELILSPFVAVMVLAFGDQLLILLIVGPISLTAKGIAKLRRLLQAPKPQYTEQS